MVGEAPDPPKSAKLRNKAICQARQEGPHPDIADSDLTIQAVSNATALLTPIAPATHPPFPSRRVAFGCHLAPIRR